MKNWIAAMALMGAASAFSQSYIQQTDGSLLTLGSDGSIYDFDVTIRNEDIREKGKTWILTKNGKLTTVNSNGMTFEPEIAVPRRFKATGGSWLLGDRGELVVITSQGYAIANQDDGLKTGEIGIRGANWFVWRNGRETALFTVATATGEYFTAEGEYIRRLQIDLSNIRASGNNWIVDARGMLFVVTKEGAIMPKRELGTFFGITTKGGNYFTDSAGGTRVILDNGAVYLPYLPMDFGSVTRVGPNYGWNTRGDFFTFAETISDDEMRGTVNPDGLDAVLRKLIMKPVHMQPDPRSTIR